MGVSMEQINQGVLDAGKLLATGMEAWDKIAGKKSVATPPIVAAAPAGGAVSGQPQGATKTASAGLAAVPAWVWLAGIGLLVWRYR